MPKYVFDYVGIRVIHAKNMGEAKRMADSPPQDFTIDLIAHNDRKHMDDGLYQVNAGGWG